MIHQWIYTIVPVNSGTIYFTAFCKACRKYFTEVIPRSGTFRETQGNLPRYGCEPIDDSVTYMNDAPNPPSR